VIEERLFAGKDNEELAKTYNNIGWMYRDKADLDRALYYLNTILYISR